MRLVGGFGAVSKDSSRARAVFRVVLRAEVALLRTGPLEELSLERKGHF